MKKVIAKSKLLVDATETSQLLGRSRSYVERLQLQGLLTPVPTIYPKYYFESQEVNELKEELTSKCARI